MSVREVSHKAIKYGGLCCENVEAKFAIMGLCMCSITALSDGDCTEGVLLFDTSLLINSLLNLIAPL